jgi:hypothetical protein
MYAQSLDRLATPQQAIPDRRRGPILPTLPDDLKPATACGSITAA